MALFTEAELGHGFSNPMAILDEATYLSDAESAYDIKMVPVRENSRIGAAVVNFEDLDRFAESYGVDYITAMSHLSESNGLGDCPLAVAIDEADVIAYPEIVSELSNVVIRPVSEDSLGYAYTMACLEAWMDSPEGEESDTMLYNSIVEDADLMEFLEVYQPKVTTYGKDMLLPSNGISKEARPTPIKTKGEESTGIIHNLRTATNKARAAFGGKAGADHYMDGKNENKEGGSGVGSRLKNFMSNNKGKMAAVAGAGLGIAAVIGGAKKLLNRKDAPKSFIGQKIAALRGIYQKWLARAQKESDQGKANVLKQAAAKLMSIIDALLKKMQNMAG